MIRDHPVTGIGIRSFAAKLRAYAPGVTETHDHPHDTVLNLWLSIGILGLLAYVWVWVETLRTCAAGMRTASSRPVFVAGIAVLVTVLAHGLVDTSLWKNDLALQFWGVLAMVTAARGTAPEVAVAA
jgi:O-antigen ligase